MCTVTLVHAALPSQFIEPNLFVRFVAAPVSELA